MIRNEVMRSACVGRFSVECGGQCHLSDEKEMQRNRVSQYYKEEVEVAVRESLKVQDFGLYRGMMRQMQQYMQLMTSGMICVA
jgi:hypothetical protein